MQKMMLLSFAGGAPWSQEVARAKKLQQLAFEVEGELAGCDPQRLSALLRALRMMPEADLHELLSRLRPTSQQTLLGAGDRARAASRRTAGLGARGASAVQRRLPAAPSPALRFPERGREDVTERGSLPSTGAAAQRLAGAAARVASTTGTTGRCFAGVKAAIAEATGLRLTGGSAYLAADQLARSGRFREVATTRAELPGLPPGAVVVWDRGAANPHGHVSIALGDGREASDHIQRQIVSLRGSPSFRVFVPLE